MDIRQVLQDCILVIFLVNIHFGISYGIEDDYEDGPTTFNRCPWIRNKLKNGRVKYRYRGRVAKFVCDSGYELAGKRSATCVAGQWSNPLPVCVARGCNRVPSVANGRVTAMYRGAYLAYDCNPGYALEGASTIYCDGRRWNTEPPTCIVATENPEVFCDFESHDLCGWTHDLNHDFDWKRNQFATPSGHVGTGPSFDHSFGENKGGYYLFIEASSPRKVNDTARIFSPVYFPSQSGGCFVFWYHMFGATTGGLNVYLKPESHVLDELMPNWGKFGDQGNKWQRGNIDIPHLHENFQIVIEGIRGESHIGDSAIDDVSLSTNDCLSMENDTGTTEKTIADSCRGRCREPDKGSSCGCNDNCNAAQNCCLDYMQLCYEVPGNDTAGVIPEESGDFYGKTLIPSTITETFTTENNVDNKSSSVSPDTISTYTTEQSVSTASTTTSVTPSGNLPTSTVIQIPKTTIPRTSTSSASITTLSSTTDLVKGLSTASKQIPISTTIATSSARTKETPSSLSISTLATTFSTATTVKSTTTLSSTSSTTQRTSVLPIITSTTTTSYTSPSTTTIPPRIPVTTSAPAERMSSVTTTTILDTTSKSPTTSTSPDVTTLSSTRKTYNLRPRPSSTTPLSVSTESSFTTNSTFATTGSISSSSVSTGTAFASSTPFITSWHDHPVFKSSTVTSTRTTLKPSTTIQRTESTNPTDGEYTTISSAPTRPTLKSSTSTPRTKSTTPTSREYTTISSPTTNRNKAQKFTFLVTATSITLQEKVDQHDRSKSQTSASSNSVPIVISVIAIVLLSIAVGVVYYMRKQRNKRQSKLSDDSEMRFLEENEHMEYSDASALDKILIK